MRRTIPFNKPCIVGKELYYIAQAVNGGNIAGDGLFTEKCSRLLESRLGVREVLLMPSCTAALETAAILCDLGPMDEVIVPSYTFVSTANSFFLRGARPVFVDIRPDTLNIDEKAIEPAITQRTKAIFVVHYAGVSCEMNAILDLADRYGLWVVEDAAQAVNASYNGQFLGSMGHLGAFSFHETKNYNCGQGGALCVNDPELAERAEIIRHKGTDRARFFRGEVDKYTWVDIGSAYVPSEITCAYLYAQLEHLDRIKERRRQIYERYWSLLAPLEDTGKVSLPSFPAQCDPNYHIFYVLLPDARTRDLVRDRLQRKGIFSVFHYVPLHLSRMGADLGYRKGDLPVTESTCDRLLRLPFYFDLTESDQELIADEINRCLDRSLKRRVHKEQLEPPSATRKSPHRLGG